MKTKEHILGEHLSKECMDDISVNIWPDILEAMEIYRNHPYQPGQKSPEDYWYEQPESGLITERAIAALTAQAKAHAEELEAKIMGFSKELTELILKPPFSLEHSQHAIACEKIADLRNRYRPQFKKESPTSPVRTPSVKLYCVCGCGAIRPGEPCMENGMAFQNCPECETPTLCDGVKCIKR